MMALKPLPIRPRALLSFAVLMLVATAGERALAQPIARSRVIGARPQSTPRSRMVTADMAVGAMRRDLRRLVEAQDAFAASARAYAADPEALDEYRASDDVWVEMLWATRIGWAARASHDAFPGWSCVIWVGWSSEDSLPLTDAEHKRFPEGTPACDGDGETSERAWREVAPAEMAGALGLLATRQAAYVKAHGTFAPDLATIMPEPLYGSLRLTLRSSGDAWSAVATHTEMPGARCTVWGGAARAAAGDAPAGDVRCDLGAR